MSLVACTGGDTVVGVGSARPAKAAVTPAAGSHGCSPVAGLDHAMNASSRRPFAPVRPGQLPPAGSVLVGGVQLTGHPVRATADDRRPTGPAVAWLTDAAVPKVSVCWLALLAAYPATGLYPVILHDQYAGADARAWLPEDLARQRTDPARLGTPAGLVARLFRTQVRDFTEPGDRPFGGRFPGLARTPDGVLPSVAAVSVDPSSAGQLLLVPVSRPADVPYAIGWLGATNYFDGGYVSAVLRSWEDRFGAQVAYLGQDYLNVLVADPPRTFAQARQVAAEHLALCPDEIYQGDYDTFDEYARSLIGQYYWSCWWD